MVAILSPTRDGLVPAGRLHLPLHYTLLSRPDATHSIPRWTWDIRIQACILCSLAYEGSFRIASVAVCNDGKQGVVEGRWEGV